MSKLKTIKFPWQNWSHLLTSTVCRRKISASNSSNFKKMGEKVTLDPRHGTLDPRPETLYPRQKDRLSSRWLQWRICHLLCNKKCMKTPSPELVNCIQVFVWLKPNFFGSWVSKFEKSNLNFWKEERISSKYREFRKIKHSKNRG